MLCRDGIRHQDTDKWFDRTLRPLLKIVGAQARRVDRIEHNDDIDDRILAEIKEADFAVADLTYAARRLTSKLDMRSGPCQ